MNDHPSTSTRSSTKRATGILRDPHRRPRLLSLVLASMFLGSSTLSAAEVSDRNIKVKIGVWPEEGWMKGGWGKVNFQFENTTGQAVEFVASRMQWMANGKPIMKPWSNPIGLSAAAKQTKKHDIVAWFNPRVLEESENRTGQIKGVIAYKSGGLKQELEYVLDVPEATLPEALKKVEGKYVSLNLMESQYKGIENLHKIIQGMDEVYEAMAELTGYRPYDAANVEFRECPRHFAWAYAGNPIVLNTSYVRDSITEYNSGIINFGWTHELGHDFDDGIGSWYIPTGQWAEYQANIKLSYAWEKVANGRGDFLVKLWQQGGNRTTLPEVTGRQFNDSYFLTHGMDYLADSNRGWETLKSDDVHSFHSLLVRRYGWDLLKQQYRAYVALKERGLTPPKNKEMKINLMCAILSQAAGDDLTRTFQQWRMPVTPDRVSKALEKYPVKEVTKKINGDRYGMYADKLPERS